MDEGRKRVLGIMAAILAARKLALLRDGHINTTSPAFVSAIGNAIDDAARIMERIDREWSVPKRA